MITTNALDGSRCDSAFIGLSIDQHCMPNGSIILFSEYRLQRHNGRVLDFLPASID
jgi:hypothetical protein